MRLFSNTDGEVDEDEAAGVLVCRRRGSQKAFAAADEQRRRVRGQGEEGHQATRCGGEEEQATGLAKNVWQA